jgi:hypothetical protein
MGLTKTSWIGVFILVSVPIFFLSFYFIGIITNVISTIEQVLVAVFAVMIISGVALIYKGWKPSSKNETNKPNFDHIQAWFFYPKKYSWGKGERDPKKHVPRQKVVLVTDSKKAYFMGKYAIDLVLNEKVRWFSDDKQENLGEWCKNKGYELMHEIGTEDLLLEAYFHAEIKDKKEKYRRGDIVIFETYYRGKLKNGFFDNKILYPEGKKFRRGRFKRKKKSPL